jgi:large subunit ribosomal protein L25
MSTQATIVKAQTRPAGLAKGQIRSLRKQGLVPGVLYGKSAQVTPIQIDLKALPKGHSHAQVITLELDGKQHPVLMREVQVHPLEDNVLHIDFQAVTPDELVSVRIPLTFVGLTREQEKEGSFRTHVRSIPVRCKVKDIPKAIEVNIAGLKVEGSSYLGDLDLGAAVRIIGQKNMALATLAKI